MKLSYKTACLNWKSKKKIWNKKISCNYMNYTLQLRGLDSSFFCAIFIWDHTLWWRSCHRFTLSVDDLRLCGTFWSVVHIWVKLYIQKLLHWSKQPYFSNLKIPNKEWMEENNFSSECYFYSACTHMHNSF